MGDGPGGRGGASAATLPVALGHLQAGTAGGTRMTYIASWLVIPTVLLEWWGTFTARRLFPVSCCMNA